MNKALGKYMEILKKQDIQGDDFICRNIYQR